MIILTIILAVIATVSVALVLGLCRAGNTRINDQWVTDNQPTNHNR